MKTGTLLRMIAFMAIAFLLLEFTIDAGENFAIVEYPIIWAVLAMLLVFGIALELVAAALQNILFRSLSEDAQLRYTTAQKLRTSAKFGWWKRTYKNMMGAKPMSQEQEIVLDHNYDGIRELDNNLPPWWSYLFIFSIIFAFGYFIYYEVFDGPTQIDELTTEIAQAKIDVAEFKKNNKDLIDINNVELLTETSDLAAGESVFTENCIACHKAGGAGGIGPNLTDDYWILGGGIKNVFHTISEGGRAGKGMISWKSDLKPSEMAQVASYVISLHGTNPADPKAAEGDIWLDPNVIDANGKIKAGDSTKVTSEIVSDAVNNLTAEGK